MQLFLRAFLVLLCVGGGTSVAKADYFSGKDITFERLSPAHLRSEGGVDISIFKGSPVLLMFWRADCAPCQKELALLPQITSSHPDLHVAVISLQGAQPLAKYIHEHSIKILSDNIVLLASTSDEVQLLKAFGAKQAYLPYSASLHADGSVCDNHTGILGLNLIDTWAKTC